MKRLMSVAVLALAGCTTQLGQFSVYTPKSVDLSKAEYVVDRTKKLTGVDGTAIYLVYVPNMPMYDQAVRNAVAQREGCVGLADMKIRREAFWLLFGYCDFIAEGYPIVRKEVK